MKTNIDIEHKIESTLNAFDETAPVRVSHFFKDKTMQRMFSDKEDQQFVRSWFMPKLQWATLIGIITLNILAFSQLDTSFNDETIEDLVSTVELSIEDEEENSIFNNW